MYIYALINNNLLILLLIIPQSIRTKFFIFYNSTPFLQTQNNGTMIKNYFIFLTREKKAGNLRKMNLFLFIFLLFLGFSQAQVLVNSENFESGFGIWNDGGNDCARGNFGQPNANFSINLQDNSGVDSSMFTNNINLSPYTEVSITFDFHATNFNPNENFVVEYSDNGGTNWVIVSDFIVNINFYNDVDYNLTTLLDNTYNFTTSSRFRIRCDASGNGDDVYIDEIDIIGNPNYVSNDDCIGATPLTVGTICNLTSSSNNNSTGSVNTPVPTCAFYQGSDVWYTVVVPSTGQVDIETQPGSLTDTGMAVYSGSCSGGLTQLECDDDGGTGFMSYISLTGLTPSETLYIRVWGYGSAVGTFNICVTTPFIATCTDDPENLTAMSTSTTSGTVSWDAPATPPGNGYEYIISIDDSTITPTGDITGTTTATSVNITGLTSGTTYYVFVRSLCNATDSGQWISTSFITDCVDIVTTPTLCAVIASEQGTNPFTTNPFNPDPSLSTECGVPSVTIEAYSQLKETTSYVVERIEYNPPVAFTSFAASSVNLTADDIWAASRSTIGFDFCYFDRTYSELLVGANSMVTFNTAIDPGDPSGYAFSNNLPSVSGALFGQTIYGVYHDIDPAASTLDEVSTRIVDPTNIGCRKFVISWHDVPMYSDNSILYTGMIVLHETTNIIEVFIEEKRIDNNNISPWNGGNAIVGIQGVYGGGDASNPVNEFAVAPCRNSLDTNWEATNEAWRFVPDGNDILPTNVNWYAGSIDPTNLVGTGTTLPVDSPNTYIVEATYPTCSGSVTLTDEITVSGGNIWTSAAGTSDWNTPGNWSNNTVPTDSEVVIIPDATTTSGRFPIILGGAPIPPTVSRAGCLTVEHNGYIEVGNGGRLIVTGSITVKESPTLTDGNLLVRSGGNLVQISEGAVNSNNNTGTIKMQRSVSGVASDSYIYWSSPVENFNVQNVSPGTGGYIFEWLPTTANIYGNWINPTSPVMGQGKGYIIRDLLGTTPEAGTMTPPATTAEFIGTPRNGVLTTQINRGNHLPSDGNYPGPGNTPATSLDDNWNLIGNPYPSSISADAFIIENAAAITNDVDPSISGTIWLWRHENTTSVIDDPFYGDYYYNYDANQYAAYNLSGANPSGFNGNIASGQAFFVLMEDIPGPTLSTDIRFTNDMRYFTISGDNDAYDNNSFLRTSPSESAITGITERHRIWLDLIKPDNTATSILVGYIENATDDIDRLYDGYDLNTYGVRLYSIIDDKEFAIQGRSLPFDQEDIVPLGVVIDDSGIHQIAINAIDGLFENESQNIYLEDTYTSTIHDLRATTYSFTSEVGTFNDRFILRYTEDTLGVSSAQIDSGITIMAPKSEYIKIASSIGQINTINIYDVLGRVIFSASDINNQEFILNDVNLANGAYIVKVELTNGKQKIQKVVLKH